MTEEITTELACKELVEIVTDYLDQTLPERVCPYPCACPDIEDTNYLSCVSASFS